jgi:hypothetical protein
MEIFINQNNLNKETQNPSILDDNLEGNIIC